MKKLRLLDLFSGIGGFSLGLERSGYFETVAFCEIEPFCRRVLAKHWPEVPCYDDVRELTAARLAADGIAVDAICGGFPCQDISTAGRGAGLAGERSGLWSEIARLVGELRPRFVVVENVSALLSRGLGNVLGDLAALGYDAEWHCIPASVVGAPHRRDRIWIIANADTFRTQPADWSKTDGAHGNDAGRIAIGVGCASKDVADADSLRSVQPQGCLKDEWGWLSDSGSNVADALGFGQSRQGQSQQPGRQTSRVDRQAIDAFAGGIGNVWRVEPAVGRVAHGVPDRVDRLKALGNAVVPQIPELIGRAIGQSLEAAE